MRSTVSNPNRPCRIVSAETCAQGALILGSNCIFCKMTTGLGPRPRASREPVQGRDNSFSILDALGGFDHFTVFPDRIVGEESA